MELTPEQEAERDRLLEQLRGLGVDKNTAIEAIKEEAGPVRRGDGFDIGSSTHRAERQSVNLPVAAGVGGLATGALDGVVANPGMFVQALNPQARQLLESAVVGLGAGSIATLVHRWLGDYIGDGPAGAIGGALGGFFGGKAIQTAKKQRKEIGDGREENRG